MTISARYYFARKCGRRMGSCLAVACLFLFIFANPGFVSPAVAQDSAPAAEQAPHQTPTRRRQEIRQRKIDNPEGQEGANVYRHSPMVHSLAHTFGLSVEATSRLFETINFILLVLAIVWGLSRILPKALRNRTERIRIEIEQARVATEDAKRRLRAVEERLARLDSEIDALRLKAEQETTLEEKRLRDTMEQEKQLILQSASQNITAATKNAQNQLKRLAADLVIEHAKRQISLSPESDQTLVQGFLTEMSRKPRGGEVN